MRGTGSKERSPSYQCGPGRSSVGRGSSKCETPLRRGIDLWPCSSGSTCHVDNRRGGYKADTWRGSSSSKGSSMFRRRARGNLVRSCVSIHGWSRHDVRRPWTRRAGQCRRVYAVSPAAGQRNDGHSEAGFGRYIFQHREESTPGILVSQTGRLGRELYSPSWPNAMLWRSHCPVPNVGCFPESPVARTDPPPLSCVESCPVPEPELAPTGRVLCPRRTPCRHASGSWACSCCVASWSSWTASVE